MTILSQAGIEAATELQEVRRQSSQLRRREDELKKLIYEELDGETHGLLASGLPIVEITTQTRRQINGPKLEAMYPDVFEKVMEEKEARVLKITL